MTNVGIEASSSYALVVVAILNLLLGTLVLTQASKNRVNVLFAFMTYAMAAWVGTNALFLGSSGQTQFVAALLSYGAAAWLTVSFVHFCNAIVDRRLDANTSKLVDISTVLLGAASVMPGFIAVEVRDGEIVTQVFPLLFYGLAILTGLAIGNGLLLNAIRHAPKSRKNQYKVLLYGFAAGASFGAVCNLLLPMVGNYHFVAYGPVGLLLFVGAAVYAITRHNLFDIRLATVRTLGYTATVACLVGVYFIIAAFISQLAFGYLGQDASLVAPVTVIIAVVLALIFQPLKHFFDTITDKIFYHTQYSTDEFITHLGNALTSTVQLRQLLDAASQVIRETLHASSVTFVVRREKNGDIVATSGSKLAISRAEIEMLHGYLGEVDEPILDIMHEEATYNSKIVRKLLAKRYALLLPLGDDLGFVLIRERMGGAYSERDMRVLAAVSDELTIAIQNARSVEGIRELNTTLQQRIDAATRELRQSNKQLKKLDETKDEFVSMASHQLRTPLTSVKGYISMVLEGDAGKITKQQEKLLTEAYTSSERMVRLIGDFLNVSRLQTGKFMIDSQPVDIASVVGEEIESIRTMAESHGQELHYHGPDKPLEVCIDEDKTRQVIMNFIDNAIYYSPSGTPITVKLHAARGRVVFEVHDKGIGVPKDKQDQLFTKFFRADNAQKQRPDGTGVGLFLAKKVIEAQDGEIIFHSREGMGSVFGFKLPIKK